MKLTSEIDEATRHRLSSEANRVGQTLEEYASGLLESSGRPPGKLGAPNPGWAKT